MTRLIVSVIVAAGAFTLLPADAGGQGLQPPASARDAQPSRTGTSTIKGRVVSADSGTPLKNVAVYVSGASLRAPRAAGTDERGAFVIEELPPGRYTISASKPGYVELDYGQRRPFETGKSVELGDKVVLEGVDFALPRGGVIVVQVTDEFGDPMAGVRVQAERYRYVDGKQQLVTVEGGSTSPFGGRTDDLGEARIYGLPPGAYFVTATAGAPSPSPIASIGTAANGRSYVRTFYPGTASVNAAQRVTIESGREVTVSFPLSATRLSRISGTVRASDGSILKNPSVSLQYTLPGGGGGHNMLPQPDGSFGLSGIPPGDYAITVRPSSNAVVREYASVPVTVAGDDLLGLSISTSKAGSMAGRIVFDAPPPKDLRPTALQLLLVTAAQGMGNVEGPIQINTDWTFRIADVMDNRVVRLQPPPNAWRLRAVMLDGRDIIDTPIDFTSGRDLKSVEIVVTQEYSKLAGIVTDAQDKRLTDYAVVVFPTAREQWTPQSRFIAVAHPDQQGRFEIAGLPPGTYLAVAVDYVETDSERDPDLLNRLKDVAVPLALGAGESKTITLKIAN